ncbi:MAG TPA: hypothetical protein VJ867_07005 [Gemmatimonadaceae bacterium]|nr:hypothetical protein [Gemmatimonadaceae bacterium]
MNRLTGLVMLAVLVSAAPGRARAQRLPDSLLSARASAIPAGTRVRVTTGGKRVVSTLVRVQHPVLVLGDSSAEREIHLGTVDSLWSFHRPVRRSMIVGALLVGIPTAAFFNSLVGTCLDGSNDCPAAPGERGRVTMEGFGAGAAVGAVLGLVKGSIGGWKKLYPKWVKPEAP